jgi:hypothetical protein
METTRERVAIAGVAWLAMIATDFLLQGGVFAPFFDWASPFLLSRAEAFVRIPIGYAGLGLEAAALTWLLPRIGVRSGIAGLSTAAAIGAAFAGAFLLGLGSISTAQVALLATWFIAAVLELAAAGWVIGRRIEGRPIGSIARSIVVLVVASLIVTVILQSTGYAAVGPT